MAKTKNKKRTSCDEINRKTKKTSLLKPASPFEVHINKEKLKVLGRQNKHNKGLPGISRGRAIDKRKNTLLDEYRIRNKSNIFTDRRIGENDKTLSAEGKQIARFAAINIKRRKRGSIFNLGEEVLTHKGQTLSEVEKFDDPRSEDEDEDENETGRLDKRFVGEAHFGSGLLKKTGVDGATSHKDLIQQLIAESKKRKAEQQKIKEATLELTDKLDAEWKDLLPLMSKHEKGPKDLIEKPKLDDYDIAMRKLIFEPRGGVSDRLKSEEEIAKEESEKLKKLELERLSRMEGLTENDTNKYTHRSADDLVDDFVYESETELTLSYDKEGRSNLLLEGTELLREEEKADTKENVEESPEDESEAESEDESETESEDDLSDLKEESSSSSENEEIDFNTKNSMINKNNQDHHSLVRKEVTEKDVDELPSTFTLPNNYESLKDTLSNHPVKHQGIIIERMIKSNHSGLAKENKENLGLLFTYIVQYINDIGSNANSKELVKNCFHVFNEMAPYLFDLAQINQNSCHNYCVELIKENFQEYWKTPKEYPGFKNLFILKLVSLLFTTSDFRHQAVTPCLIFIEEMLMKCRVRTRGHIAYGLFISTLTLEYTSLTKRFMPGCINYLGGILHMAIPKSVRLIKVLPPFRSTSSDLVLLKSQSSSKPSLKMEVTDLVDGEITELFKIRALYTTLMIINEFYDNFKDLASNIEIFEPIYNYCKLIKAAMYPEAVKTQIKGFLNRFEATNEERKLIYLSMKAKAPKALRLYEPKIVEVYDGKRYKVQSREKAERDKLIHKVKREKKSTLREIRKDNAFLGRVKITQQIESDKHRREKVKRIFAEASIQQSELNELDRKKKRK